MKTFVKIFGEKDSITLGSVNQTMDEFEIMFRLHLDQQFDENSSLHLTNEPHETQEIPLILIKKIVIYEADEQIENIE